MKDIAKKTLSALLAVTCAIPAAFAQTDSPPAPGVKAPSVTDAPAASKPGKSKPMSFGNYLSGRFAESQGDTGSGIQFLREALRQDPDNKDKQKSLYRMLILTGDIEGAIPLAHSLEGGKVVEEGSEFSPEMLLAIEEAKTGQYAGADRHLASIPRIGYNSLLIPLLRSWLKLGMHEVKAPVDVKDMASEGHVVLPHVYLNAALINDLAGFDAQAQKQYEAAVKDTRIEPFRAVQALANFYARKGMPDKQRKLVEDYIAAHGESYLADELLGKSRSGASQRLVANAGEGLAEVFYTLANIFHGARTVADEVATLHLALYLRADFPAAQFLLANAYELAQNSKAALAEYKSIRADSPYFTRGRIRSAYDEIELGHKDSALSELDTLAKERPDDIDPLLAKGDILRAGNQFQSAIGTYDQAISKLQSPQKRDWIVYYSRGASYQLAGNAQKAEADMQHALKLDPTQPEVLNYLGYSWLTEHRNLADAKKMIEKAYEARPEEAHIIDSMGYSRYIFGDFAGAEQFFSQALERTPNDATVNDHLGDTYWQLGRKTEARYQWERALTDKPDAATEKDLRKKLEIGLEMVKPAVTAEKRPADLQPRAD